MNNLEKYKNDIILHSKVNFIYDDENKAIEYFLTLGQIRAISVNGGKMKTRIKEMIKYYKKCSKDHLYDRTMMIIQIISDLEELKKMAERKENDK